MPTIQLDRDFYYQELYASIPETEKDLISSELASDAIVALTEQLKNKLANSKIIFELSDSRNLFLAALRGVKHKQISIAQLATLHILDSAIRTLYTNPAVYFLHKFVNSDNQLTTAFNVLSLTVLKGLPNTVKRFDYRHIPKPKMLRSVTDLPALMQKPLIQRFFNFTDTEWNVFCLDMKQALDSERYFYVLNAPEVGCWSSIIFRVQKTLKCMHVLEWLVDSLNGLQSENIMLVPSFTMFQAALNAKAHTLDRKPIKLIPTYGYIEVEQLRRLKSLGATPLTLYLPERDHSLRYKNDAGSFRADVDGHPLETAFGGAIHDVYHAMREMAMTESVAKARLRLATIAKDHPKNKMSPKSRCVDEVLIDGELIHSYPPSLDTMFIPESRTPKAEPFGKIFYIRSLCQHLDGELRRAFIEDMVINKELWQKEFGIGQTDLLERDRLIYDEIQQKQPQSMSNRSMNDSAARAIGNWGILAPQQRTPSPLIPVVPVSRISLA